MPDDDLLAVLATIRERGPIGEASLVDAVRRADAFVASVPVSARTLIDLGSGGGLPALVIAVRRPDLHVTMIERRATRADLLRRAVAALRVGDRCVVLADDVAALIRRSPAKVDVVTARSFASPRITATMGSALLHVGGLLLVAEPPDDDPQRWPDDLLAATHLVDRGKCDGIRILERR